MKIVISSGHSLKVRGASDILDEVDEARKVVERVADILSNYFVDVVTFHDDVSTTQSENLDRIVDFHNSQTRDLDISVHFNAYEHTTKPMGTEVLYITQNILAADLSKDIAYAADLPNRGPKKRTDLAFLNGTEEPAVLIETCFVDSTVDADHYRRKFEEICKAICDVIADKELPEVPSEPPPEGLLYASGRCSWFGGPQDTGVSSSEGLAFLYDVDDAPHLFLMDQPPNTTGLARRLNPELFYVACRWDYDETPKDMLATPGMQALVRANGREFLAWPADWGPHESTGRVADLSPGLMAALGLETDDEVEIIYPAP